MLAPPEERREGRKDVNGKAVQEHFEAVKAKSDADLAEAERQAALLGKPPFDVTQLEALMGSPPGSRAVEKPWRPGGEAG